MDLPPELAAAFAVDPEAEALFGKLRPGERQEWADFVAEAKRPETRVRRGHKVGEILRNRVARAADREERGVADLGKRFDKAMRAAVTEVLRPVGFANAKRSRTWRRILDDRVDVVHVHRMSTDPDVGRFRVEASVVVRRLSPDLDPSSVDGGGYDLHALGQQPLVDVDGTTTEDDVRRALVATLTDVLVRFAAVDVTTAAGVERLAGPYGGSPEIPAAFGDADEARRRFATFRPPLPFDDPTDHPSPWLVDLARGLGFDPSVVPTEPPGGFIDLASVQGRLTAALGDRLLSAWPKGEDWLDVRVWAPAPTSREVAVMAEVPGHLVRVTEVRRSLGDCLAIARELEPLLLDRERAIEDLTISVFSCGEDRVVVAGHRVDAETEALVRSLVPADVLTLIDDPHPYAEALLHKRQRLT